VSRHLRARSNLFVWRHLDVGRYVVEVALVEPVS